MSTSCVRYENNQDTKFFLCRECRTHLALHKQLLHRYENTRHGLFDNLVNVTQGTNYPIVTGQTAAPVACTNCDTNLGARLVALQIETAAIRAGRLMIDLKKLLFWNGKQMVYADSGEPVKDA